MSRNRTTPIALIAAIAAAALPLSAAAKDNDKGEAELAEILEGREAGEPVSCLTRTQRDRMQIVDRTALVFRDGRTIYVNRPTGVRLLDDFDVPVFRIFGSQLCRSDQFEMRSRAGSFAGPTLVLGEFVPYTKIETDR